MVDLAADAPRTRRALLAGAAAAGAAVVANAVVKPIPALAAVDDNADMYVGTVYGDVSTTTGLVNHTNGTTVFSGNSSFGTAILGTSSSGSGGAGVSGVTNGGSAGIAVKGSGGTGRGVVGETTSFYGVHATATSGQALRAESTSGYGAYCASSSNFGLYASSGSSTGAYIVSSATNQPAAQVIAAGGGTAVRGHAGNGSPSALGAIGVHGSAEGSGIGGLFSAPSGYALQVQGRAAFSRAGKVSIPKNRSYVDISVAGGFASGAGVVATLQIPRGTCAVTSVRVNYPTAGKARIYLNKVASTTAATPVGYFVFG